MKSVVLKWAVFVLSPLNVLVLSMGSFASDNSCASEPHAPDSKHFNVSCGGGQGTQVRSVNGYCVEIVISTPHNSRCFVTIDWGDGNVQGPMPVNSGDIITYCYTQCGFFQYTVFLDCSCDYTLRGNILITVPISVDIQTQGAAVCEGIPVTLEATIDTSNASVIPPLTYYWNFGNGDTAIGNPVTYTYPSAGTYVGTVRVEDASGCWGETQFIVTVEPTPQLLTNDIFKCKYDTALMSPGVISGTPPYTWTWAPSYALTCDTCQNTNTYTPVDTTYYITVVDVNGCYNSDSVRVNVFPQPVLTAEPDTICPKDTTSINLTLVSG
ncbi:MAG: PKD domain-containing protein, partial [Chlorobi bacterium]|nr:PKD domain-containing protein [Chlorobiota bacterium]